MQAYIEKDVQLKTWLDSVVHVEPSVAPGEVHVMMLRQHLSCIVYEVHGTCSSAPFSWSQRQNHQGLFPTLA
eukprot:scaffold8478_cov18-Tisochrysis_lutea.AAC.2